MIAPASIPPEFLQAVRESKTVASYGSAKEEPLEPLRLHDLCIETAAALGPLAAGRVAHNIAFSEQTPVQIGDHHNRRFEEDEKLWAPTTTHHDYSKQGIMDSYLHRSWQIGSMSGTLSGSSVRGIMGAVLTPRGKLFGYKTWRFDTKSSPVHYGFHPDDPDTKFTVFRKGEEGLREQEGVSFGRIRERAVYVSFGPEQVWDSLVSFAKNNHLH